MTKSERTLEWDVKDLGKLVTHKKGFAFKSEEFLDGGYPIVRVSNFTDDSISLLDIGYLNPQKIEKYADVKLKYKDVVIATVGSWPNNPKSIVGRVIKVPKNAEGALLNQNAVIIRPKNKNLDNDFLFYRLREKDFSNYLMGCAQGSANQASITLEDIFGFCFELPKVEEQQAIAKVLSNLDSKIELNNKTSATLEAMSQAIFKHWFVDFEFPNEEGKPYKSNGGKMIDSEIGKIPQGWSISKVGKELHTVLGGTPSTNKKEYWTNGTIPWINSGKVNEFRITEPSEYITKTALTESATKLMPKGTTVLAITGATLGQVSRIEAEMCGNQSVIGIVSNENISSEYTYFWVKNNIDKLISNQTGGAQQHINKENVNNLELLIPEANIMKQFTEIEKPIFTQISNICFESLNISKIRESLLPKLMSGKIRVPIEVTKNA